MTISAQQKSFLSEILEDLPIPESTLIYFRERFRDKLHSAILEAFLIRSQQKDLKRQDLAARIHRTKAQISRWFSAPSNLTLDSISDLMVGLGMDFDAFPFTPIEKTIIAANHQISSDKADLGKTLKKAARGLEGTSAIRYWEQVAFPIGSSGRSISTLAPSPSSGAMASTVVESLQQCPSAKVVDLTKYNATPSGQNLKAA